MKRALLEKLVKISKYTAEQGNGWPTHWGFHEIVPDEQAKELLKKMKHDKENSKKNN